MHTKGPWHRNIKPATKYSVVFAGRNTHVARVIVDGLTPDEVEANINLIAAAPELLELAQRVANLSPYADEIGAGMLRQLVDQARAVTNKATES
jgi:hypothetical protein